MPTRFVRSQAWFLYLDEPQKRLVDLAEELWHREKLLKSQLSDYGFVVFPMAKAYEGFLKKFLYDMNLISQTEFESKHFRIGRALNPNLKDYLQDEKWVYDDVARVCGPKLAQDLWQTWTECRNRLFHYYYQGRKQEDVSGVSLDEAGKRLDQLALAMQRAVSCKFRIKEDRR